MSKHPSGIGAIALLTLLSCISLKANTITLQGTLSSATDTTQNTLTLHGDGSYTAVYTGPYAALNPFVLTFIPLALPAGSTLNNVSLTLNAGGTASPPVTSQFGASTQQYIAFYQPYSVFIGYGTYPCGLFHASTCTDYNDPIYQTQYEPVYQSGYAGSASFSATGTAAFSNVVGGPDSVALPAAGGTVSLPAISASDLNAGLTVNGTSQLSVSPSIFNYGYYSTTYYSNVTASFIPTATATLNVDYTLAPEPGTATIFLLGAAIVSLGCFGRQRRQKYSQM